MTNCISPAVAIRVAKETQAGFTVMASEFRKSLKPHKRRLLSMLGVHRDEVVVVSYPKSGRTWLQLMLGEYITRHFGLDVQNVIAIKEYTKRLPGAPRIKFSHDERPHWKPAAKQMPDKSAYRDQDIILLARDPRDIIVSLFFEKTRRVRARRSDRPEFKGSINDFVYHDIGGIDSIITFFNSWYESRNVPKSFRIVRYEDLRQNTREALADLLTYLRIDKIDEQILNEVVQLGDIDRMRKAEADSAQGSHAVKRSDVRAGDAFQTRAFQPANPDDPDSFKVRKGKVGGYTDYLGEKEIEYLDKRIREDLNPVFGY
jgi:hypothetical protein